MKHETIVEKYLKTLKDANLTHGKPLSIDIGGIETTIIPRRFGCDIFQSNLKDKTQHVILTYYEISKALSEYKIYNGIDT